MPIESYGVHWFRRDLRVAGNPALQWSWKRHQGRVVGVFCFDKKFLARPDFSHNRFQFFLETLKALSTELKEMGSELLFLDIGPDEAFAKLFQDLKKGKGLPTTVSWNRDYEPFAMARDERLEDWFRKAGVEPHHERDHLLIEPHEVLKESDRSSPYQVYSPYQRKWLEVFKTETVKDRLQQQKKGIQYLDSLTSGKQEKIFSLTWKKLAADLSDDVILRRYAEENAKSVTVTIPEAGSQAALARVRQFAKRVGDYGTARDVPGEEGTSRFSIYFKNGSLTVAQAITELSLKAYEKGETSGKAKFLSELIWREFYYYILAKFPYVERESFQRKFLNVKWGDNEKWFERWKEGTTGFPIVDAGMRELKETGWMHNRVRMIVASFLTKDLLINWQWGERYFMETLLDGDLAPNNGGWQWAASTGCDPQPYFRIFNPWLQSKKFDPEATYIKRFVPELREADVRAIHDPEKSRENYPEPLVDHSKQRVKAIELYEDSAGH